MQRSLKVAVALNLSVGALANYCFGGQKHKDDLTGLKCIMGAGDAQSCASECCEPDPKKCGSHSVVCPSNSYFGTDFASKHTAVPTGTAAEANKVCCKPKATCASVQCPVGYEPIPGNTKITCSSDAASCAQNSVCCQANTKTCAGALAKGKFTVGQLATKDHYIPAEAQQDAAWKTKVIATVGTEEATCKIAVATCKSDYTCPAGLVKAPKTAAAGADAQKAQLDTPDGAPTEATKCTTDATSCIGTCCVAPAVGGATTTCGGLMFKPAGAAGYFVGKVSNTITGCDLTKTFIPPQADLGEWKNNKVINQEAYAKAWAAKSTTVTNKKNDCCLPIPTCSSHTCPAGQMKKTGLAKTAKCATTASCTTDCCQDDATTCGGLANIHGIKCKYGFYNEMDSWTSKTTQSTKDAFNSKNATLASKDTACCTPRAPCAIPGTSTPAPNAITTTPAAVVTTTPAAAALKFSDHKIAVEGSQSSGVNMLWLGVGAVVGMGVLMVVQGLRSKRESTEAVTSEDADALLNTVEE